MREIAAEVGVRAGALYLYTPDKQTLLFDLMHDHLVGLEAAWDEVRPKAEPFAELQAFVNFHLSYHLDRKDEVHLAYMELSNLAPDSADVASFKPTTAPPTASGDFWGLPFAKHNPSDIVAPVH